MVIDLRRRGGGLNVEINFFDSDTLESSSIAGSSKGVGVRNPHTLIGEKFAHPEKVAPSLKNFAPPWKNRNIINSIVK